MNVKTLIEQLQECDEDDEVKFVHESGDYWNTRIAADISTVEDGYVKYSNYHRKDVVDDRDTEDEVREVVLLS